MKYGLSKKQLEEIIDILSSYKEVEEAVLFGSRAIDTYKEASDVDIAIKGEKVNWSLSAKIKDHFEEETYLPFFFDIIAYPTINNDELKKHINTKGIVIYRKNMSEWKTTVLSEIAEIEMGQSPKGETCNNIGDGIALLNGPTEFGVNSPTAVQYTTDSRRQCKPLDILFCVRGSTTGKMNWADKNYSIGRGLAAIRHTHGHNYRYFLKGIIDYNLDLLLSSATGSTFPNVTRSQIEGIEINLPPLPEQKAIASVLSSLDDKIDLLHRQNKTLEQMAETLFRQWFVEEAEESWEEKPLSSIATFLNGLACQKYPPQNEVEKIPVLKIKELRNGISKNSDWCSTDVDKKYIIKNGDIIFSWSASLMVKIWDGEDCILNQHLFKVTSDEFPKWYCYLWSKHHLERFIAIAKAHATTMGHIKRGDLDETMVFIPSKLELTQMTKKIEPLIEKTILNNNQIHTFEKMRDTLLPKLMSGEVRVEIKEKER